MDTAEQDPVRIVRMPQCKNRSPSIIHSSVTINDNTKYRRGLTKSFDHPHI